MQQQQHLCQQLMAGLQLQPALHQPTPLELAENLQINMQYARYMSHNFSAIFGAESFLQLNTLKQNLFRKTIFKIFHHLLTILMTVLFH